METDDLLFLGGIHADAELLIDQHRALQFRASGLILTTSASPGKLATGLHPLLGLSTFPLCVSMLSELFNTAHFITKT